jgi:hypothetical protein
LSLDLNKIFSLSKFSIYNSSHIEKTKKDHPEMLKIQSDNYFFAADTAWLNIYGNQEERSKRLLPLDDDFYLNIPADHVEKLENGSIMVILYNDPEADTDTIAKKIIEAEKYYEKELTKLGLWGKLKWSVDWREKNREFLKEKGFLV